jgi:hypothetical protein
VLLRAGLLDAVAEGEKDGECVDCIAEDIEKDSGDPVGTVDCTLVQVVLSLYTAVEEYHMEKLNAQEAIQEIFLDADGDWEQYCREQDG